MKDDITIDGTNAALSQQEEDTSTATKLYRTQDAATLAGIQSPQLRNARKRFMQLAKRLNLSPADERRRERGGGSPEKFWTFEQVQAVKAEHELTKAKRTITLADRVNRIRKLTGDTARNLIEIGKHLTAAKDELPHGDFSAWVQDNFGWTIRTAQNLMAVAERFGDMDIANFKPSHLQALLALPSGDEQKFIAEQAAAGQPVETQSARQLKENIKQHNRQKSKGTKAKTFSHLEPTKPAITPTSNALSNLEHVAPAPAVIDVNALTIQEVDSEPVTTSGDNTANDSPADETADALIDSELADIFARIDKITDADKLRRIQAHISERLAEIDGKKISLQTPASR